MNTTTAEQYKASTISTRTAKILAALESIETAYAACAEALTDMYGEDGETYAEALPFEDISKRMGEYLRISVTENMSSKPTKTI